MHQIHFQLRQQNNDQPIPVDQGPFLDIIHVPFWNGTGPFASDTLRMDFRGMDVGDSVLSHSRTWHHGDHPRASAFIVSLREPRNMNATRVAPKANMAAVQVIREICLTL